MTTENTTAEQRATTPERGIAGGDLEDALADIREAADLIFKVDDDDPARFQYLARQILRHQEDAWDSYCRIFGLDHHRTAGRPGDEPPAADDAELLALIAEHKRLLQNEPHGMEDDEADRFADEVRKVRARIEQIRPTTLAGVLAVFEWDENASDDPDYWPVKAVEGLRAILGRTGGAA